MASDTLYCEMGFQQVIAMKAGRCSAMNWQRPPGRPWKTWIQQIGDGTTTSWRQAWQSAEERGHCGESSQRTIAVCASWWWWWWWCSINKLYKSFCRPF